MTSIEFLIEELIESQYFPYGTPIILIKQAKEMEKQQVIDAFNKGFITDQWDKSKENKAEQYYNEIYKNTEK